MSQQNPFYDKIQRYRSPEGITLFVKEVLGKEPDDWQEEVLRHVASETRGISTRSAHGVGKSAVASWAMLWMLLFHYTVKIVVTAPTSGQLYDALFAEVKRGVHELPEGWQSLLNVKADKIELVEAPNECFISARTAGPGREEALQGIHSDYVLLVVDEASGVDERVFEAAIGSMSGENATTLLLSNPTRTSGFFYDTHNSNAHRWATFKVSADDSPRVSNKYVEEVASAYGRDSNAFRVRVLAEFPRSEDDVVVPLYAVEAARGRDIEPSPFWGRIWGLDVARYGDDKSVLTKMHGRRLEAPPQGWNKLSTMELTGRVYRQWQDTRPDDRPTEINVDVIGVGAGVVDRLRELGLPARGINVSELPAITGEYKNLRTELWFRGRDWFMDGMTSVPDDPACEQLYADLVSVKYTVSDSQGLLAVEKKDDTKKRIRRSPDYADSFLLCLASDAVTANTGSRMGSNWNRSVRRKLAMP